MGDIDLKVISATENSNKFQKTRFWKEKSLEDLVTLGPMVQATLVVFESKDVHTINCIMSLFKVGLFTLLDPHESTLQTQAHSG